MPDLYAMLVSAGVEVDHRESDLYAPNVGTVRECADKCGVRGLGFTCAVTGRAMLEFPFQYTPFWERAGNK